MSPVHPIDTIPAEARRFQGQRAGIVTRVTANVIDVAVVIVILGVLYVAWAALLLLLREDAFTMPTPSFAVAYLLGTVILGLYFVAAWSTTGRTYGDHLLGLRVVNFEGERLHPLGALLRSVACVMFPVGLLWCVVSRENRSLQDLVIRTSVIYDWEIRPRGRRDA